ncbi:unnamed protein product [Cercopithifilaria johnstoni]|uniref:Uncharacterized protein n=1 Tax=Cercopithifilaria johnstoni TaxID=2874296 RepID=A0A8J2M056_9BILA|nr:unnamed protein product [Cercopithifilaria johnstoni]
MFISTLLAHSSKIESTLNYRKWVRNKSERSTTRYRHENSSASEVTQRTTGNHHEIITDFSERMKEKHPYIITEPNFTVAIASPLLQPAQLKPVAGRAVYSHMVASSSVVPSPALCQRPQNAVTPDHYPMTSLGPNSGALSSHTGAASSGMPFRGQFMNHAIQMSLPPHMSDG